MTDLLDLLDTTIEGIGNSKTTENNCVVPVVPVPKNRFGNNNPLKNKTVRAVPVVPSQNNASFPESGNSNTPAAGAGARAR